MNWALGTPTGRQRAWHQVAQARMARRHRRWRGATSVGNLADARRGRLRSKQCRTSTHRPGGGSCWWCIQANLPAALRPRRSVRDNGRPSPSSAVMSSSLSSCDIPVPRSGGPVHSLSAAKDRHGLQPSDVRASAGAAQAGRDLWPRPVQSRRLARLAVRPALSCCASFSAAIPCWAAIIKPYRPCTSRNGRLDGRAGERLVRCPP